MTEEEKLEFMNYLDEKIDIHFFKFKHEDDIKIRTAHKIALDAILDIQCTFEEIIQR